MSSDNRGLASADEETKERVARKGGEAVSQDTEHMAEIGRKGGEASPGGGRESSNEDTGMTREEAAAKSGRASRGGRND